MKIIYISGFLNVINAFKQIFNGIKTIGNAINTIVFYLLSMFGIHIPQNMIPLANTMFMLVLLYFSYKYLSDIGKYLILIYIIIIFLSIISH